MTTQSDFADWLSPMLVKELRQGMRSRLFVISFLILQGAMMFVALLGLAASADQSDSGAMAGFFWTIISVPLLVIMPMSGLGAIGNERKANTLELILLTRVTARRIVAGKWFAIVAQTVLLVCAILPYAVLRYFVGGINLGSEFVTITLLLLASALLSGFTVGLSPQSSRVTRTLLVLGIFFGLQVIGPLFAFRMGGIGVVSGGSKSDWRLYAGLAGLALSAVFLMLEFGASKIAPPAENHSTSRRLIAFFIVLVAAAALPLGSPAWVIFIVALLLLIPVCVGALCEAPRMISSIYRPFLRFGFWGRCAGRLFYPGWPSGVLFALAVSLAMAGIGFWQGRWSIDQPWIWWTAVAAVGTLLFPAAIIRVFFPRARRPGAVYIIIQTACCLLVAGVAMLQGFKIIDLTTVVALIPVCGLIVEKNGAINDATYWSTFTGLTVITSLSVIALLITSRSRWREIEGLERVGLSPAPTSVDAARSSPAE